MRGASPTFLTVHIALRPRTMDHWVKKALDIGAMTRDEYDREREKILDKD